MVELYWVCAILFGFIYKVTFVELTGPCRGALKHGRICGFARQLAQEDDLVFVASVEEVSQNTVNCLRPVAVKPYLESS